MDGPVLGAILLGGTQQLLAVTISSEVNVLVLGIMLVLFVVVRQRASSGCCGRATVCAREARHERRQPTRPCCRWAHTRSFGGFIALDNISVDIERASGSV